MSFSTFVTKVITIATWAFLVSTPAYSSALKGSLPSLPVLANFLNTFIKPLMELEHPSFRAVKDIEIEKVIYDKITELKPYLQDEDDRQIENDTNDTTIIEFVAPPQKNINPRVQSGGIIDDLKKYSKLRKKISKALRQEDISNNTKHLIENKLDEMVYGMLDKKCSLSSGPSNTKQDKPIFRPETHTMTLATVWDQLWQMVFKANDNIGKNTAFLGHFNEFVTKVLNDSGILKDNIHFICQVHDNKTNRASFRTDELRRGPEGDDNANIEISCESFKVCSTELKSFMRDFYTYLNDTGVATLTNYAAMFMRDVNGDGGNEKEVVIENINKTSEIVESKINSIFQKQTANFKLDKNKDKNENIKALTNYVKKTISFVRKQIMKDLSINLNILRPKLLLNIQKDIEANMDMDLGNLESELTSKICMVFATCNGKFAGRRGRGRSGAYIDKNSVYVQIKLTLDDEKSKLPIRRIGVNVGQAMKEITDSKIYFRSKDGNSMNPAMITRTTFKNAIKTDNQIDFGNGKKGVDVKRRIYGKMEQEKAEIPSLTFKDF